MTTSGCPGSVPVISGLSDTRQGQNRDNFCPRSAIEFASIACLAFLLFGTVVANGGEDPKYGPLPRTPRRRNRKSAEKGLPDDEELKRLAQAYLETMRRLWPEITKRGLFPQPSSSICQEMADDFKRRHRGGAIELPPEFKEVSKTVPLAGNYDRYSCENSSPLSIVDQMVKCLEKAKSNGHLIPWSYVFADYSTSGRSAARRGYQSYKALLKSEIRKDKRQQDRTESGNEHVSVTYIDDFTRASRDELEWWKLAFLSRSLGKGLLGASDNFDLADDDWDVKIGLYGLLSRLFLAGLSQKVRRGMKGAASRGRTLGKIAVGHTRRIRVDEFGNAVHDSDGSYAYDICIDPVTQPLVLWMFEQYVIHKRSLTWIARECNRRAVDGWVGWTAGTVKIRLANPSAIGVFIWNRTRTEYDPETQTSAKVKNPRSAWCVNYRPELALVPKELWRAARRRATEGRPKHACTGKSRPTGKSTPVTLFSNTLLCRCGKNLTLSRSAGKYKCMQCVNGAAGTHWSSFAHGTGQLRRVPRSRSTTSQITRYWPTRSPTVSGEG